MTITGLSDILKLNYLNFVIDFGVPNIYTYSELKRCTHRLAVVYGSPWKKQRLESFLAELEKNNIFLKEDIMLLGNLRIKENKPFSATIPFIENPFQITSKYFGFFEELLERK